LDEEEGSNSHKDETERNLCEHSGVRSLSHFFRRVREV
jgi:hypothetical protein